MTNPRLHSVLLGGGAACAAVLVLVACAKGESALDGSDAKQSGSALSFSSGNDDGYCASNPSAQCGRGTALAARQLVLTFDDGPGSQTLALSSYLRSQGIRATFFVNGHCFGSSVADNAQCQQNPDATAADLLAQVVADGHLVGNHTQDHLDLSDTSAFPVGAAGDGAIVRELADTDALIAPFVAGGHFVFRAPFGAWSARDYTVLHQSAMDKYVGPVKWDIGSAMVGTNPSLPTSFAADWDCWQDLDGFGVKTTKECGDRYLHEIAAVGRGIILMHDADYGDVGNHDLTSGQGNTIDMVKYLIQGNAALGVTGLKAQGYTFLRIDEVPDLAAALGGSSGGDGGGGRGGADAGRTDAGAGSGSCGFDPTWAQTSFANEWWVEYTISGAVTSADLQVVGGATVPLSSEFGKWVGGPASQIPTGAQVILHAKDSAAETAATQPFAYLVQTQPVTACSGACLPACSGRACGDDGCGGTCGACPDGQSCTGGACIAAGGCSGAFSPTWSQGSGANNWWVEYAIGGGAVASASLEVVGGESVPLTLEWGKWVGPADARIATGASVIVHAQSTAGAAAQTLPFGYLDVVDPPGAPCTP